MPQPRVPAPRGGPAVSRRAWIGGVGRVGLGLAGLLVLDACTTPPDGGTSGGSSAGTSGSAGPSSGRSGSGATPSTSVTPALLPGAAEAVTTETRLCATVEGILAKSGSAGPSSRQRLILTQLRDAHLDHLRALSADPRLASHPATPAAPRAAKVPSKLDDAVAALVSLETTAARQHRGRIGAAAQDAALVWASLSTAADSYAAALRSSAARSANVLGRQRQPVVAQTRTEALSALLAQVYAALYGYQTALPKLTGADATTATDRITSYYQLRDSLSAELVALKATPPAAEPAYVLNPRPTGATSAGRLIAGMETRIQPYLGQWVATSGGDERTRAAAALTTTAVVALRWGGALNRWPGWT